MSESLKETGTIKDMVRGNVEIDLRLIKEVREIRTDNGVTTQISMHTGEHYYIEGKGMHEVADELHIVLGLVA